MTMACDDAGASRVARLDVFTGLGRRCDRLPEVNASIVAESLSGQETICSVVRRHGMSPSQLFTGRRQLRKQMESRGAFFRHLFLPWSILVRPPSPRLRPVGEERPTPEGESSGTGDRRLGGED